MTGGGRWSEDVPPPRNSPEVPPATSPVGATMKVSPPWMRRRAEPRCSPRPTPSTARTGTPARVHEQRRAGVEVLLQQPERHQRMRISGCRGLRPAMERCAGNAADRRGDRRSRRWRSGRRRGPARRTARRRGGSRRAAGGEDRRRRPAREAAPRQGAAAVAETFADAAGGRAARPRPSAPRRADSSSRTSHNTPPGPGSRRDRRSHQHRRVAREETVGIDVHRRAGQPQPAENSTRLAARTGNTLRRDPCSFSYSCRAGQRSSGRRRCLARTAGVAQAVEEQAAAQGSLPPRRPGRSKSR